MTDGKPGAPAFHHVELNVTNLHRAREFYEPILEWLGWEFHYQVEGCRGWRKGGCGFYLLQTDGAYQDAGYHRKRTGLSHIAFGVPSHEEVDRFTKEVLIPNGIEPLYGSPVEDRNYEDGYKAVYFEDPDRIKVEVAHSNATDCRCD
jgi:catechol 2,3-dioxygenase-like lactoylglutathione lyase family enzyme